MAVTSSDPRRGSVFLSRLHFLVRLVGLLGVQAALVGVVMLQPDFEGLFRRLMADPAALSADLQKAAASADVGGHLLLGGLAAALFALFVEVIVALRVVAGRRSALGGNAVVQVALAAALLVGVNVWSFRHPARFDWTRDRQFTLPASVRAELAKLDPDAKTTIVLYQRHRAGSLGGEKPDPFDLEAERKVVEKVKDLVELFREVGPQFQVEVLDVADRGFNDRLDRLTAKSPELKQTIEEAPENSIFVHAGRSVQRLSFNEFYRLDRTESERRDNLVLRAVGPGPITRRVINVEERRPRVGILVMHEALSSEGPVDLFTLSGAGKALKSAGFEVRDVVLRNLNGDPAADVLEVSKLERMQDELDDLEAETRSLEREIKLLDRLVREAPKGKLVEVNRLIVEYAEQFNPRFALARANEANRELVGRVFNNQLAAAREGLDLAREARATVSKELSALSGDKVSEQRRLKDLQARLARNVTDVDLLIVPRLTMLQNGAPIANPTFHDLDERHAKAVREFLKAGKPVLACLGPTNSRDVPGRPGGGAVKPPDELEKMFAELGIVFGKRTVLFNVEKRAFANRDENLLRVSKPLQVPELRAEPAARTLLESLQQTAFTRLREPVAALGCGAVNALFALPFLRAAESSLPPNPVRESLRLADQESGKRLNLRLRFLRPVFLDPLKAHHLAVDPEVLSTSAASWHDEQPFGTPVRPVPRFEPPALDDPDNGTLEARRRGPFSVGLAVETRLPPGWGGEKKVRVAALGQAGLFTGPDLAPGQERLLVDTCNWLLGRDEQLARAAPEWSYPRVPAAEEEKRLWLLGARWGLPELFAFLGLVVLLARRLR
ncbi:MAG: hypothetical protein U0797_19340 [Gemmataceae bacterium]